MFSIIFKLIRHLTNSFVSYFDSFTTHLILFGNNVQYKRLKTSGIPYVMVARGGEMFVGDHFVMNNGIKGNPIGCYSKCTFFVDKGATLIIGDNVGVSQTALICHQKITIGDNVKMGGGVKIYDTDFHSLDSSIRNSPQDLSYKICKPVTIQDGAFIGAFSIILKGVEIGKNSIIGAGSVVTKSVPSNQIWAGNPAKFIKEIN